MRILICILNETYYKITVITILQVLFPFAFQIFHCILKKHFLSGLILRWSRHWSDNENTHITLKRNNDYNQVPLGGKNLLWSVLGDHVVDGVHHLEEAPPLSQHSGDHLEQGGLGWSSCLIDHKALLVIKSEWSHAIEGHLDESQVLQTLSPPLHLSSFPTTSLSGQSMMTRRTTTNLISTKKASPGIWQRMLPPVILMVCPRRHTISASAAKKRISGSIAS